MRESVRHAAPELKGDGRRTDPLPSRARSGGNRPSLSRRAALGTGLGGEGAAAEPAPCSGGQRRKAGGRREPGSGSRVAREREPFAGHIWPGAWRRVTSARPRSAGAPRRCRAPPPPSPFSSEDPAVPGPAGLRAGELAGAEGRASVGTGAGNAEAPPASPGAAVGRRLPGRTRRPLPPS